jgi:type I restriction enzyme S subunit
MEMVDWPVMTLREAGVALIDCVHKTPATVDEGFPYVTIPQMKNGRIDFASARRISHADFLEWTKKARPKIHDVILSRRTNPGVTATFGSECDFALGQNLVLLRADGSFLRPDFLRWLVVSPAWWAQIEKFNNVGALFNSLRCADVPRFELPIPPKHHQTAMASTLAALDNKIELNRRMNETLEALTRSVFKDWFVDFGPTRAKIDGRPPYLAPEIWSLFPDRFDDEGKPESWRFLVLEEILAEIQTGARPKGGVSGYTFGIPSVGAESIVALGQFDYSKTKFIPREFFETMNKGHVKSRDVLLYKDGGRPGQFEPHLTLVGDGFPFDTFAINEHVYRLRANPHFGQNLLYFWLSSDFVMEEMRIKGTGVAIPGLNSTQVKSLTTLLPSPQVAAAFDRFANPAVGRILANCSESRLLARTRDLLLPKLMSGEIRVSDAERLAGQAAC